MTHTDASNLTIFEAQNACIPALIHSLSSLLVLLTTVLTHHRPAPDSAAGRDV